MPRNLGAFLFRLLAVVTTCAWAVPLTGQTARFVQPAPGIKVDQFKGQVVVAVRVTGLARRERCYVTAHVTGPAGIFDRLSLHDDGSPSSGDETSGDRVFTNTFLDVREPGKYTIGPVYMEASGGKKKAEVSRTFEVLPGSPATVSVQFASAPPYSAKGVVRVESLYRAGWQEVSLATRSQKGKLDPPTLKLGPGASGQATLEYTRNDLQQAGEAFTREGPIIWRAHLRDAVITRSSLTADTQEHKFVRGVALPWWEKWGPLLGGLLVIAAVVLILCRAARARGVPVLVGSLQVELVCNGQTVRHYQADNLGRRHIRALKFEFPTNCPTDGAGEPKDVQWIVRSVRAGRKHQIVVSAAGVKRTFSPGKMGKTTETIGACKVTYSPL